MKKKCFFTQQRGTFRTLLSTRLDSLGIKETQNTELSDLNFINSYEKSLNKRAVNILLLIEPKSVMPEIYETDYWAGFDAVVALGRYRAEKYGLNHWIDLPFDLDYKSWATRNRKTIVMVNASKYSANRDSLYSLRRKVLTLDAYNSHNIQLFGDHWNENRVMETRRRVAAFRKQTATNILEYSHKECWSEFGKKYPQHLGKMDGDFKQIISAKLAIVIENEADYVSEKIWTYLNRGVVPVYVGPDLAFHEYIKDFVFVAKPEAEEVLNIIQSVGTTSIESKIKNYRDFVATFDPKSRLESTLDNLLKSVLRILGLS